MMPYLLCIETSTTVCSVALFNGIELIALREINNGYTHAENLHLFIDEVVKEAGILKSQLAAVAVGKGPGSYTGLRIGVSAAKGISFALKIPLIGINSLQNMAFALINSKQISEDDVFIPMLDARRMEVYMAIYDSLGNELQSSHPALIQPDFFDQLSSNYTNIKIFGDGASKCIPFIQNVKQIELVDAILPSATNSGIYAYQCFKEQKFEDPIYFDALYLKEFFSSKK